MLNYEDRFKIPERFTVIPAGAGEFRLHSLSFSLALRDGADDLLASLLPLLDGDRTVADLAAELDRFAPASVEAALERLLESNALERVDDAEAGFLSGDERERFRAQLAFFSHFTVPPEMSVPDASPGAARSALDHQRALKEAHVVVVGLGRVGSHLLRSLALSGVGRLTVLDDSPVRQADVHSDAWFGGADIGQARADSARRLVALSNADIEYTAAPSDTDYVELLKTAQLGVLCLEEYNPSQYRGFNRAALATRTPWTSGRLSGFEFHIGPTVVPYETCCFECFELRQKSNVPDFSEYRIVEDYLDHGRLGGETLAITPAAGLLALEVLKAITWFMQPAAYSHLYALDLLTMRSHVRPVLKVPRCPACGAPAQPRPTIHIWQQSDTELSS